MEFGIGFEKKFQVQTVILLLSTYHLCILLFWKYAISLIANINREINKFSEFFQHPEGDCNTEVLKFQHTNFVQLYKIHEHSSRSKESLLKQILI